MVAGLIPATGAAAATTYNIQIGQFVGPAPAEVMSFFPRTITIHKGDTLRFTSETFHTATLLEKNIGADDWVQDHVGPGGDWSLAIPDPDEDASPAPAAVKANPAVFFPSDVTCGSPDNPCSHDGSTVTNSGAPLDRPLDFSVTVAADPGDTLWALCLIHPHIRMRIVVVPDDEAATTQEQIDSNKAEIVSREADWAAATHKRLNRKTAHQAAEGGRVVDAYAGYDNHLTSLFAFYPANLTVTKGQKVRWHFSQLIGESHSVTMPLGKANDAARNLIGFSCDPDGDGGSLPDNPPDLEVPPFCSPAAGDLELDFDHRAPFSMGDGRMSGRADFEHSGLRGPDGGNFSPFDVKFTRRSGRNPFKYICILHPFMQGSVRVTR